MTKSLAAFSRQDNFPNYRTLQKLVKTYGLISQGTGKHGELLYSEVDINDMLSKHSSSQPEFKGNKQNGKKKLDMQEARLEKLENDIRESKLKQVRLEQERERADLEIEELKSRLIEADEVKEFLLMRYGVENAILRRILFVNAPIELTGLEVAPARNRCEEYFNDIQDVLNQTLLLWQQRNVKIEESTEIPEAIQNVIKRLNDALKGPNE